MYPKSCSGKNQFQNLALKKQISKLIVAVLIYNF